MDRRYNRSCLRCILVASAVSTFVAVPRQTTAAVGVVAEVVTRGRAGAAAGMSPGDVLLTWERRSEQQGAAGAAPAARGELRSPFDFIDVEREEGARGVIRFIGRRGGEPLELTVRPLSWRIEVRPAFDAADEAQYERGKQLLAGEGAAEGAAIWREMAAAAESHGDWLRACWLLRKLGQARAGSKAWPEAHEAFDAALVMAKEPRERVAVHFARAQAFEAQREYAKAHVAHSSAVETQRGLAPESLRLAFLLHEQANCAWFRGDLDAARPLYAEALALRERFAPEGWVVAVTLHSGGNVQAESADHAGAEARYQRALDIYQRMEPDGSHVGLILNNLGIEARIRGDFARAEALLLRALEIRKKFAADEGEEGVARALHNLGNLAYVRRDLDRAQQLVQESLAVYERAVPNGPSIAMSLNGIGIVAMERGDLDTAERELRRGLALAEKLNPRSIDTMNIIHSLARLEINRGALEAAETLARKAMEMQEARSPQDRYMARQLETVGEILALRGRLDEAEPLFARMLAIHRRISPGSSHEATALVNLAKLARRSGQVAKASELYREAFDVVDRQSSRLGGGQETKLAFGREFESAYRDAAALLVDQERSAEALHVLERSRARSFLALLAERDVVDAEVPAELDLRRRRVDADYDRVQAQLSRLDASKEVAAIDELTGQLRELRATQAQFRDEIRRASPRTAALRSPQPLDVDGMRSALDPGSVLLSYAVGEDRTDLFAVTPETGLQVFRIPLGRKALEEKVRAFRLHLAGARPADIPPLKAEAADLYAALLAPAESALTNAARVVICPDAALHTLPFAALRRGPQYLIEWKPLHVVLSATVYAELRKARPGGPSTGPVLAFGDPRYPLRASADPEAVRDATLRDGMERGLRLTALPATRREAESIAALYGRDARVFVGEAATEERAKSESQGARYVHFACHGFVDERLPLNSGLALTTREDPKEGQDNGLLQAWEVFERVRVDADLVTLSACDSGLGKDMGGEGLIGLTRAFQFAGARSVVASLWAVSDDSTADLMRTFYEGLRGGRSKDEALRAAQIAAIRKGGARSWPFRWAGFQLFGDWR